MVATVGSISIDLSTNAAKFAQGFKSAATTVDRESSRMSKAVNGFSTATKTAGSVVSGFVGGIVAGGALAALGSLSGVLGKARQALSDFEEIGNRARTTGLKTDFFQALSFGALQADVDQEKLNKSLEVFAKNVGLAREGTGALYSGLIKLNPELLKSVLTAGDQEQRLKLVADAMKQTSDATQRAALANAVFGKGGVDLVRVLDGGAAALDDFKRKAQDLGLIIPDDLIQKAGELDDKLEILAKVIDVNISQALVNAAPLIVTVTEKTAELAREINALSGALTEFANNPSVQNFGKLLEQNADLIVGTANKLNPLQGIFSNIFAKMIEDSDRSTKMIEADIVEVQKYLGDLFQQAEQGADVSLEVGGALQKLELLKRELAEVRVAAALTGQAASSALATGIGAVVAGAFQSAARSGNVPAQATGTLPNVRRGIETGTVGGSQPVDEDVLEDVENAIDDQTGATQKGFEKSTASTNRATGAIADLGGDLGGYFGNVQRSVDTGTDEIRRLREEGKVSFNYSSIEAAVRTGIVTGMDDSLLGKQYKQTIAEPLKLLAKPAPTDEEGNPLSTIDRLRSLTTRFSYAGKFAEGGSFTVGGSPSGDRNLVTFLANEGEKVTVTPRNKTDRPIVLNYYAAAGESERTARQNARAMLEAMTREAARS